MEDYKYIDMMSLNSLSLVTEKLKAIRHVALDMDGTIYKGNTLFPFTISCLKELNEMGISYSFLTNNPSKNLTDYLTHLAKMGIEATEDEVYTSSKATIDYIKYHYPEAKRLFILGTPSMINEFEKHGFISIADDPAEYPDILVVGFDMSLEYKRLCRASWWASKKNIPYIATNPDWICPTDQQTILVDCGSICKCIEAATGVNPDIIIGKPSPRMLEGILTNKNLKPYQIAMIGDRIYTDVKMAENAGAMGVLVFSGEATMKEVDETKRKPDIIADNLKDFLELLKKSRAYQEPIETSF